MTTKNTAKAAVEEKVSEAVEQVGKSVETVIERVAENQDRFVAAATTARDRSRRISDECVKSFTETQRDALALTKQIAAEPTAHAKHVEAMMASASAAQARAMAMTQMLYREQVEAASELQTMMAPLFESTKSFGDFSKNFDAFFRPNV